MAIDPKKHPNSSSSVTGFTLIEIMVVVITLGVITSLALINYNNVMEQNYCRTAQQNLLRIQSATEIARLKNKPIITGDWQATLGITVNDPKFTYFWGGYSPAASAGAMRTGGPAYGCILTLGNNASSTNPSCGSSPYCPSIFSP